MDSVPKGGGEGTRMDDRWMDGANGDHVPKIPIPAQLIGPWIEDNGRFISDDVERRNAALQTIREARGGYRDRIRVHAPCAAVPLSAVDAAYIAESIGDLVSLLVQAIHVDDAGTPTLAAPVRITGVSGHEMSQLATPVRVAEECALLADASPVTVADTSFWSLLMEVNQAITLRHHHPNAHLADAVESLTERGLFLATITNPHVIAMSKSGEARTLHRCLSDREAWSKILDAGEYTEPQLIAQALAGHFGIERRGFNDRENQQIRDIYEKRLGVVYYKPHAWSRAYRIEAQMDLLLCPDRLMPVLAAVHGHTDVRSIIEPWPQFLADYLAKHLSSIGSLYGRRNYHRTPFDASRTGDIHGPHR